MWVIIILMYFQPSESIKADIVGTKTVGLYNSGEYCESKLPEYRVAFPRDLNAPGNGYRWETPVCVKLPDSF